MEEDGPTKVRATLSQQTSHSILHHYGAPSQQPVTLYYTTMGRRHNQSPQWGTAD